MIKIEYPSNIIKFNTEYYTKIKDSVDETAINLHLNKITYNNKSLTFERLITFPFDDILQIIDKINNYINNLNTDTDKKSFNNLFNYTKSQPLIASFFMYNTTLKLSSCYYCNIDFVNSFSNISSEFSDELDFVNRAKKYELSYIKGIGKRTAKKIISSRNTTKYTKTTVPQLIINDYKNLNSKNKYNHFTLDHILPQSNYHFLSLCLYNLVPSCYACNSKFKKAREFDEIENLNIKDLKYIIPSSTKFSFDKDFNFRVLYNKTANINSITKIEDYRLDYLITKNKELIEKYLEMFKIFGRYLFHKDEILKLIENKIKYTDSKIKSISKLINVSESEIKKDIFGVELFDENHSNKPLIKFKRDIAKSIGIKNIL